MKVVIQRVKESNVKVDGNVIGSIKQGMNILVGFTQEDNESVIDKMINKIINLRIFDDENHVMNKSVQDIKGQILLISQFTLYGDTKKGNRPSYVKALNGSEAVKLYDYMYNKLNEVIYTQKGQFGADMEVNIVNDGPVTIIIEN